MSVAGVFFRVDGADIDSGQEKILVLEADTGDQAEEMAREQGLVIAGVRAATEEDRTSPKPLEAPRGDSLTGLQDLEITPPVVTWPNAVQGKSIFSDGPSGAITAPQARPALAPLPPKPIAPPSTPARPAARIVPPRVVRAPGGTGGGNKAVPLRVPPVHRAPAGGAKAAGSLREAGGLSSGSSLLAERVRKKPAPFATPEIPLEPPANKVHRDSLPLVNPMAAPMIGDEASLVIEAPLPAVERTMEPAEKISEPADAGSGDLAAAEEAVPLAPSVVETIPTAPPAPSDELTPWGHAPALVAGSVVLADKSKIDAPTAPAPIPQPVSAPSLTALVPVAAAPPARVPRAHSSGNWLATLLLSPLAFLSLAGGVALLVYSLSRPDPVDPTDLQKLDLHVQLLTHCFLGGMLVLAGLLLFVAAGLVYVGGTMKSARR